MSDTELEKIIIGRFIKAKPFYFGDKVAFVGDSIDAFPPFGHGISLTMGGA